MPEAKGVSKTLSKTKRQKKSNSDTQMSLLSMFSRDGTKQSKTLMEVKEKAKSIHQEAQDDTTRAQLSGRDASLGEKVLEISDDDQSCSEPSSSGSRLGHRTNTSNVATSSKSLGNSEKDSAVPSILQAPPPQHLFSIFNKGKANAPVLQESVIVVCTDDDDLDGGVGTSSIKSNGGRPKQRLKPLHEQSSHSGPLEGQDSRSADGRDQLPALQEEEMPKIKPAAANSGSQQDPIAIASSPIKATSGFFAPRIPKQRDSTEATVHRSRPRKIYDGHDAQFPPSGSQHTKGPQKVFPMTPLPFHRYKKLSGTTDEPSSRATLKSFISKGCDDYDKLKCRVKRIRTESQRGLHFDKVLASHDVRHPAITRLSSLMSSRLGHEGSTSAQHTWNEKWRPRRACEVLGNESSAQYLKAWLLALAVQAYPQSSAIVNGAQNSMKNLDVKGKGKIGTMLEKGTKRPLVIRAVSRKGRQKRRRIDSDDEGGLDDWIVDDNNDEFEDGEEEEELDWGKLDGGGSEGSENADGSRPELIRLRRERPLDAEIAAADDKIRNNDTNPEADTQIPTPTDFTSYLTNTILLTGPQGCGKTAAVYACADELGWEIFEVYPGIGKRNGAGLGTLVGDVGRNHMVGRAPLRSNYTTMAGQNVMTEGARSPSELGAQNNLGKVTGRITSMFSPGETKFSGPVTHLKGTATIKENIDSHGATNLQVNSEPAKMQATGFGFLTSENARPNLDATEKRDQVHNSSLIPRQSIILLEEVDILYNEDANFWPAVINLIKDCRRPVIMTCNDASLVPLADLPMQTVLTFTPCPSPLATSYLQCLALKEGYLVSSEHLAALYELPHALERVDLSDDLTRSSLSHRLPVPDIRRTINNLQLICQGLADDREDSDEACPTHADPTCGEARDKGQSAGSPCGVHAGSEPISELERKTSSRNLRSLERFTETVSYVDSNIQRRPLAQLELFAVDGRGSSADDELGHTPLLNPSMAADGQNGIAFYSQDESIAEEALRRAGKADADRWPSASDCFEQRTKFTSQVSGVLSNVVPVAVVTQAATAVHLDYEAWIRRMVAADDDMETSSMAQRRTEKGGGRVTRNSQRAAYVRWVSVGGAQRGILRDTAFRVSDTF